MWHQWCLLPNIIPWWCHVNWDWYKPFKKNIQIRIALEISRYWHNYESKHAIRVYWFFSTRMNLYSCTLFIFASLLLAVCHWQNQKRKSAVVTLLLNLDKKNKTKVNNSGTQKFWFFLRSLLTPLKQRLTVSIFIFECKQNNKICTV